MWETFRSSKSSASAVFEDRKRLSSKTAEAEAFKCQDAHNALTLTQINWPSSQYNLFISHESTVSPNSFPVSVTFKFEYEIQSGEHAEATELHAIGVGFETQDSVASQSRG